MRGRRSVGACWRQRRAPIQQALDGAAPSTAAGAWNQRRIRDTQIRVSASLPCLLLLLAAPALADEVIDWSAAPSCVDRVCSLRGTVVAQEDGGPYYRLYFDAERHDVYITLMRGWMVTWPSYVGHAIVATGSGRSLARSQRDDPPHPDAIAMLDAPDTPVPDATPIPQSRSRPRRSPDRRPRPVRRRRRTTRCRSCAIRSARSRRRSAARGRPSGDAMSEETADHHRRVRPRRPARRHHSQRRAASQGRSPAGADRGRRRGDAASAGGRHSRRLRSSLPGRPAGGGRRQSQAGRCCAGSSRRACCWPPATTPVSPCWRRGGGSRPGPR